jgi:CRISPR-associated protein Cmr4
MPDAVDILFLYAEEPIHAGVGTGLGAIDQPIQREVHTDFPVIYGSSLRGALKDEVQKQHNDAVADELFGSPSSQGPVSVHDARIVLFPVQSLFGGFAWVTCPRTLAVLQRSLFTAGLLSDHEGAAQPADGDYWELPGPIEPGECLVPWSEGQTEPLSCLVQAETGSAETPTYTAVLREYAFRVAATPNECVKAYKLADWLSRKALPRDASFAFWRRALPTHLVVLSDEDFSFFSETATQVITRVKLGSNKTVEGSALWAEEALPPETLLHAPIITRAGDFLETSRTTIKDLKATNLGGTESIGRGRVALTFVQGGC